MKILNISAILLSLCSSFTFAVDKFSHDDWVCFIDPFDLNPENRINILGSVDVFAVLHVEENGKTIKKENRLYIRKVNNIDNARAFGFTDGSAMAIIINTSYGYNQQSNGRKLEIKDGWHPAIYYKQSNNGGLSYRCKAVELVKE